MNENIYKRSKIVRIWFTEKRSKCVICDLEGNFNLMCSNPRAVRLLTRLREKGVGK